MRKKLLFAAAVTAVMMMAASSCMAAGEAQQTEAGEAQQTEAGGLQIEAGGLVFEIPAQYRDLVTVQTEDLPPDEIIRVSETASIEAAKEMGEAEEGAGWLFSISHMSDLELGELRCGEMAGREVFAEGDDGVTYLFCHPTDVRRIRSSDEEWNEALDQYFALDSWAATDVRNAVLADNPQLERKTYSNTELDMYLARARFDREQYEIRSLYTGTLTDTVFQGDDDALEALTEEVLYDEVTDLPEEEKPDGEYIVMAFEEGNVQFDFFLGEGLENMIREVKTLDDGEKVETLYRASFKDPGRTSTGIMKDWIEEISHTDDGVAYESETVADDSIGG